MCVDVFCPTISFANGDWIGRPGPMLFWKLEAFARNLHSQQLSLVPELPSRLGTASSNGKTRNYQLDAGFFVGKQNKVLPKLLRMIYDYSITLDNEFVFVIQDELNHFNRFHTNYIELPPSSLSFPSSSPSSSRRSCQVYTATFPSLHNCYVSMPLQFWNGKLPRSPISSVAFQLKIFFSRAKIGN